MNQVHITQASLRLIVKSLQRLKVQKSRDDLLSDITSDFDNENGFSSDDINELFNNYELKDMYHMKMLLKNFKSLVKVIKSDKKIVQEYIKSENRKYRKEVQAPAFHNSEKCEWIHKPFTNIRVEDETKVIYNNSGTSAFENMTMTEILGKTQEIKGQLKMLFNTEIASKIKDFRYAPQYKIRNIDKSKYTKEVYDSVIEFHQAKRDVQNILYTIFRDKYNAHLTFDSDILSMLGFRYCKSCASIELLQVAA